MTKSLVVDASFCLNLIVPGARQSRLQALATGWKNDGYELCAPTLWTYEITSALCKLVRFGELITAEGRRALALANALDMQLIHPDEGQCRRAFDWTRRLNRAAAYDSFYLALAETLGCELWTADKHLRNAVELPWVRWTSVG
jgi:predicted nucleic acid-binding protein